MSTPSHHKRKHHRSKEKSKKSKKMKKQHQTIRCHHDEESPVSDGKLAAVDYGTILTRKTNSDFEIGSGGLCNTPSCNSSNKN
jgi:hypothetical protein